MTQDDEELKGALRILDALMLQYADITDAQMGDAIARAEVTSRLVALAATLMVDLRLAAQAHRTMRKAGIARMARMN